MKFHRVNEDKLQIIISKEDFAQRDITHMDFMPQNPEARKVFQDILEEARERCGFDVGQDAQLMIEAYPVTGDSILVNVTKLKTGRDNYTMDLEELGHSLLEDLMHNLEEDGFGNLDDESVYRFEQLEDVIHAAKRLTLHKKVGGQLVRFREEYYLLLEFLEEDLHAVLSEYGEYMIIASAFFQEHGQMIMEEKAIEILSSL